MRGVGNICSLRSVLALALTAIIPSGCSRPAPRQSGVNEGSLTNLGNKSQAIRDIYKVADAVIKAGNAFKDAWDRNQSIFADLGLSKKPDAAQIVQLGNNYTDALAKLNVSLNDHSEALLAASLQNNPLRASIHREAKQALLNNLQLASGRTALSLNIVAKSDMAIHFGLMTPAQINKTSFKTHNEYMSAIVKYLNIILHPYAQFATGYEAPSL